MASDTSRRPPATSDVAPEGGGPEVPAGEPAARTRKTSGTWQPPPRPEEVHVRDQTRSREVYALLGTTRWVPVPADLGPSAVGAMVREGPDGTVRVIYHRADATPATVVLLPQELTAAPTGARVFVEQPWPGGDPPPLRIWELVEVVG